MASILPTQQPTLPPDFLHLHRRRPPVDRQRRIALFISYAPDWLLTILVAGLFFLLGSIEPFKREFSLNDTSIQHTYAVHERVTDLNLFLIALVAPLVIMVVLNLISIRSFWDIHTSWLGAILGLALTGTVTNILKSAARDRTALIAVGLSQTDNYILKDGFRSFPSGHSSLSFAGLGFLSFYMAGKLHLFDERGHTGKAWISLAPLMGAALVAITRTMDNRHHWHDVLTGALLGFFLSWFAYRQYYPGLSHPLSHRPYSPRVSRIRPPLPHIRSGSHFSRDEETEQLQPPPHVNDLEDMELQGPPDPASGTDDTADLRDVWRQGQGTNILPPGQAKQPSLGAGEQV